VKHKILIYDLSDPLQAIKHQLDEHEEHASQVKAEGIQVPDQAPRTYTWSDPIREFANQCGTMSSAATKAEELMLLDLLGVSKGEALRAVYGAEKASAFLKNDA